MILASYHYTKKGGCATADRDRSYSKGSTARFGSTPKGGLECAASPRESEIRRE